MKSYIFRVELEQEDDVWSAIVPALPGCYGIGDSAEEAMESVRETTQIFVELMIEDGQPIPKDESVTVPIIDGPAVAVVTGVPLTTTTSHS